MIKVYYVLADDQNNYYDVAYDLWCKEILDAQRFYLFTDALKSAELARSYGKKINVIKVETNLKTVKIMTWN